MRKMIVVAVREYAAAVKTKAFLLMLLLMPIMMGGSVVVQILLKDKVDTRDKKFAVIDYSGVVYDTLAAEVEKRNDEGIFTKDEEHKQIKPRFLVERVDTTSAARAETAFAQSERVMDEEILAFIIIGPDVVTGDGLTKDSTIAYHSNSPTYDDFRRWASSTINAQIHGLRLAAAGLDIDAVAAATKPISVGNLNLLSKDESGTIKPAEPTNRAATFLVPMGMMMLMFMVVMVGATPLVNSTLEEKMQRIAEVLLGSIPPFQLMLGKLIGTVGVSLTIATLYLVGGFFALKQGGYAELFPAHVVWWFVLYVALAVLMYGSLFIAIGAAVTDIKESQNLMTPVMLLVVSPMFVWMSVLQEPTSQFSVIASLIPPATPMLMIIRQTVPPGIPLWQPLLGVALVLMTTLFFVFAAGRIFRAGILMQGRGAKPMELLGWVFRG